MKHYDFEKAKKIIEEKASLIKSAALGMHEDWFWTANNVWEDGKYSIELNSETEIAFIKGSTWATPTLQLIYLDGDDEMIPCFTTDGNELSDSEKAIKKTMWAGGVISSQVQANITPLSE